MKKILWLTLLLGCSAGLGAMEDDSSTTSEEDGGFWSSITTPVKNALNTIGNGLVGSGIDEDSYEKAYYDHYGATGEDEDEFAEDGSEEELDAEKKRSEDVKVLDECLRTATMTEDAAKILADRQGDPYLVPFINAAKKQIPKAIDSVLTPNPRAADDEIKNLIAWTTALSNAGVEFEGDTTVVEYKGQLEAFLKGALPGPADTTTKGDDLKKGSSWFSTTNLTIGGLIAGLILGYFLYQNGQSDDDSRREIKL